MTAETLSYFPGCSLQGTAREFDRTARAVCEALGVTLRELPDWNCCGASSAHRTDEQLSIELPARNLRIAAEQGMDLVIPCAACYNRVKAAQAHGGAGSDLAVISLLDLLARPEVLGRLVDRAVRTLRELPVVPYYGCLLTRPAKVVGSASAFEATAMDDLLLAVGADVRRWSCKTTCCGASFTLAETDIVRKLCSQLRDVAVEAGAKAFVVACPMCLANLDTRQDGSPRLPTFFITELLAVALGLDVAGECWKGHRTDPRELLGEYGLIEP